MNSIIKNELNKVTVTKINYKDTDTEIFIPKTIKVLNSSLKKGEYYLIKLYSSVTNPAESSVLASNWNSGEIPKHEVYIAEIIDNIGNMIKVNSVASEDITYNFYGWLPYDGFEVIKKI